MKIIIQRTSSGSVAVNNQIYNQIQKGMVILVGFTKDDNELLIDKMVTKIINLRIFDDEKGIMNKSILDINGEILLISQFTLYADTTNGNRPSYIKALESKEANKLYTLFAQKLNNIIKTKTGIFGENMLININNDGPVTIIIEK